MSVADYDLELTELSTPSGSQNPTTPHATKVTAQEKSAESSGQEEGAKAAFIDITERQRKYGDPIITPTILVAKGRERDKPFAKYALLLRRKINDKGESVSNKLEIRSRVLQEALQKLLASCSYLNLVTTPIVIKEPYEALFQFRHEIREYAASPERTAVEAMHLKELVHFINVHLQKLEKEYNKYAPSGLTTFSLLWTHFRPETLVMYQTDHFQECYRVSDCNMTPKNESCAITAWSWDYNGISFGPTRRTLHIPAFHGARKITELNVFPVDALPDVERRELSRQLIERGRKWRHSVDSSHRQYVGPAWVAKDRASSEKPKEIEELVPVHVC